MTAQPVENCFRFCPRCGKEQATIGAVPFRCSECDYANFFGPVAAVGGLLVDDQDRLLLVRRARDPGKGMWGLPGGFVDRGETIEEALRREVDEEVGLRLAEIDYLVSYPNSYNYRGMVAPVIDLFYACKAEQPIEIQLEEDELESYLWVTPGPKELSNMAFPSNRRAIEHLLSQP